MGSLVRVVRFGLPPPLQGLFDDPRLQQAQLWVFLKPNIEDSAAPTRISSTLPMTKALHQERGMCSLQMACEGRSEKHAGPTKSTKLKDLFRAPVAEPTSSTTLRFATPSATYKLDAFPSMEVYIRLWEIPHDDLTHVQGTRLSSHCGKSEMGSKKYCIKQVHTTLVDVSGVARSVQQSDCGV